MNWLGPSARITTQALGAMLPTRERMASRSRRFTRLRTTAFPTDFPTVKPTRAPDESVQVSDALATWTTSPRSAARAPRRIVVRKSVDSFIRCTAGNMARPTAQSVPCDGALRGSHGQRGYAYEDGIRAPWPGAGCSAETSACSRLLHSLMMKVETRNFDGVTHPSRHARGDPCV